MGIAAVKIKIMPVSADIDLEQLKKQAKEILEKEAVKNLKFEEEPIAFGLNAIIAFFAWQEEKELEPLQEKLKSLENIQSAEISDIRRAFG